MRVPDHGVRAILGRMHPKPILAPDEIVHARRFDNGVRALWSPGGDSRAMAEAIASAHAAEPMALAIVWFSRDRLGARILARAITRSLMRSAPGLAVCGSSTCGEITPDGLQASGSLVVLLPAAHFDVSVSLIERIDTAGMQQIAQRAGTARHDFLSDHGHTSANTFALTLIDGLTFAEEATTAALQHGLDEIPLVGGSAGDDLGFERTELLFGGSVHERAALLLLICTRLPFRLFTDNNFVPTPVKLVVTRSDPDRRMVHELDARPAAEAYALAIGCPVERLDALSFAAHPLILRIGGEHYCRSIQRAEPDGSLTFFCAIDDGLVLTVARSEGMVRSSRSRIEALEAELGPLGCLIVFDCIYRKLDAVHRGVTDRMEALFREKHCVGCNTYGEQFGSMHVNQTFTGVAFGH